MELPFQIVERESFQVIGYRIETTNQKKEGRRVVPECWKAFLGTMKQAQLMPHMNQEPYGCFGISEYNIDSMDSRRFAYYIAVSSTDTPQGELSTYTVPEMTWAVFPCTIETMGKIQAQAITKWLPRSDYSAINKGYITGRMKAGVCDIECYLNEHDAQIWVGVTKKKK